MGKKTSKSVNTSFGIPVILKHAKATEILIQIIYSPDSITITVEDDGIGFKEQNVKMENNGWNNIRSRVNYLQGTLNIYSNIGAGTSVTILISS